MDTYEKALQTMNELFAKDYQFAMATVKVENITYWHQFGVTLK
jgi:hypothetical protein